MRFFTIAIWMTCAFRCALPPFVFANTFAFARGPFMMSADDALVICLNRRES